MGQQSAVPCLPIMVVELQLHGILHNRSGNLRVTYMTEKPLRMADCHPEEKYHAKGLCKKCYQAKNARRWYENNSESVKKSTRAWSLANPEKKAESNRKWVKENPEKDIESKKAWERRNPNKVKEHNLSKYGLTLELYEQLSGEQNNVCAVCKETCTTWPRLSVDHCHETGKVRGLLCSRCNLAVGQLRNNPTFARSLAEYLEASRG